MLARNALKPVGIAVALAAFSALGAGTSSAANNNCRNTGSFSAWLQDFQQEARANGISARTVSALNGLSFDKKVYSFDRRQGVFAQSFLEFSDRMVAQYRLDRGRGHLKKSKALFDRIESQFGVPGAPIVGFWGLETDFGANLGNFNTLRALATLAYDCRRPEKFRPQLMAALQIIERGDLRADQMRGAWAGELGQTQFLPSDYLENGVDFDGDGQVNLLRSSADALASTAKVLAGLGWRRGEPWLEEVRVPDQLPWEQADLAIQHPRSQWVSWGVTYTDDRALQADATPTTLLLPMGRNGPAFLAYPNFRIYLEWNKSLVYATTAAYYATRLAGAPRVGRGKAKIDPLSINETKDLQQRLVAMGHDVGSVDGIIGAKTRAAVKAVQLQQGLPADSYPTRDLLRRLR